MKSRNKDKKTHENIIGKIIYGFLLFMPLLAIGVTCITCFWNKEVSADNEVANIEYKYVSNDVQSSNDLIRGNLYTLTINQIVTDEQNISYVTAALNLKNLYGDFSLDCNTLSDTEYLKIQLTRSVINFRNQNNSLVYQVSNSQITFPYSFDVVIYTYIGGSEIDYTNYSKSNYNEIEDVTISYESFDFDVKNIFYYSIDKIQQSPLFNWAEDSAIYTGMTATCNTLNITTPFIPLLMTYWLIISVIYILYDIILVILHIFHKKIHQLEDSF